MSKNLEKSIKIFFTLILILVTLLLISKFKTISPSSKDEEIEEAYQKDEVKEENQDNSQQLEVKEEIKNGVYTNYTYGFRFEYDESIFTVHSKPPGFRAFVMVREGNSEYSSHWLTPGHSNVSKSEITSFQDIKNLKTGQELYNTSYLDTISQDKWPFDNKQKLDELKLNEYNCVSYYNYPTGGGPDGIEPSWSYIFECLNNQKRVGVGLHSISEESLLKYKSIFRQIVDSFEIIN